MERAKSCSTCCAEKVILRRKTSFLSACWFCREVLWEFCKKNLIFATMETKEQKNVAIEAAESIESKYRVNYVESGLPRWLIEVAFVCYLMQAVINWTPLMHWMEIHAPWATAIIQTFGALVM